MNKIILFLFTVILTTGARGEDILSVSASRETADIGEISSVYLSATLADSVSNVGMRFSTGLNFADIINSYGETDSYVAWDIAMKFGYFSDLSFYVEGGFDLGEALVDDSNENEEYDEGFDNVDYFLGAGTGLTLENLGLNFFGRYRHLNGLYLEDTSEWFTGMEFSIYF